MGNFIGTYRRTLDSKKRLQIPSKLVKEMPHSFYVLRGFDGCLAIYEEAEFNALLNKLDSLDYTNASARNYIRLAASSAAELEVDSHGRISITAELAETYHIGNDVTIIGAIHHFEIWDSASYEAYLSSHSKDYEALAEASVRP